MVLLKAAVTPLGPNKGRQRRKRSSRAELQAIDPSYACTHALPVLAPAGLSAHALGRPVREDGGQGSGHAVEGGGGSGGKGGQ